MWWTSIAGFIMPLAKHYSHKGSAISLASLSFFHFVDWYTFYLSCLLPCVFWKNKASKHECKNAKMQWMVTMRWHIALCNHFFFASLCKSCAKRMKRGVFLLHFSPLFWQQTSVRAIPVSLEAAHNVILNLVQDLSAVKENRGSRWDAETSSAWRWRNRTRIRSHLELV